ncbi:MAG TPA: AtpZ/AtpI family protein [Bacteroidales bacterium]|nr:AtpZ/AtpI family protein [Bacteroidales bacterium]
MEEPRPQKKKNQKRQDDKGLNAYAKYSGMAFQMVAIIAIATWGGIKLDNIAGFQKPVFTIILSLLGVFGAIYFAIRDFIK